MESVVTEKTGQNMPTEKLELIVPTPSQKKAQRNRSIGLAIALLLFVVLVYIGTVAKLGANIFARSI